MVARGAAAMVATATPDLKVTALLKSASQSKQPSPMDSFAPSYSPTRYAPGCHEIQMPDARPSALVRPYGVSQQDETPLGNCNSSFAPLTLCPNPSQ